MKYQAKLKKINYKFDNSPNSLDLTSHDKFMFGYASAAAQIENGLHDIWLEHAQKGHIPAFDRDDPQNIRNNFWDNPDEELQYVYDTGVDIFRMGLDWQRICPSSNEFSIEAINKYKSILKEIRSRGIKTMVTLYHHSEPVWTHRNGSWLNSWMVDKFCEYADFVGKHLHEVVDYWNTFNEVQMYITLTQLSDFWPCVFNKPRPLGILKLGPLKGVYHTSIENVSHAHNRSYQILKSYSSAPISVAHNLAYYIGDNTLGSICANISWKHFNFKLIDLIKDHLDFLGINYYGAEVLKGSNLILSEQMEYSDSGRAIYPKGLYEMICIFYKRYKLPIFITENGMSDATDKMRPKYMIEHLIAVQKAMSEGIPVLGYIWWSMTDNLEWADGYLPKFGLVDVKREDGMIKRSKRKSYDLYKEIVKNRSLDRISIDKIRKEYSKEVGSNRYMTRDEDAQKALGEYRSQPIRNIDWGI